MYLTKKDITEMIQNNPFPHCYSIGILTFIQSFNICVSKTFKTLYTLQKFSTQVCEICDLMRLTAVNNCFNTFHFHRLVLIVSKCSIENYKIIQNRNLHISSDRLSAPSMCQLSKQSLHKSQGSS